MRATSKLAATQPSGSQTAVTWSAPPVQSLRGNGDPSVVLHFGQSVVTAAIALDRVLEVQSAEQARFTLTRGFGGPAVPSALLKNAAAISLLSAWLNDDSGYDEAVWPGVKDAIEAERMSARRRFHE